nr:hypothetical protein [Microbacterium hydrocarbonoxydans]
MDRKLVLDAQVAIPVGHRVEVTEHVVEATGKPAVLLIVDLETGIRYRREGAPLGELVRWFGRVIDCTVTIGGRTAYTALAVDTDGDGSGAAGAEAALLGADAAVDAAKAQAARWGGGDRKPEPEPERFW